MLRTGRPPATAAHRLMFSAAEFDVLRAAGGLVMPPGFNGAAGLLPAAVRRAAVEALVSRDVLMASGDDDTGPTAADLHPSVAANLAVLARPEVLIRTDVSSRDGGLLAVHAVAGQLGAALFAAADGGAEMSMFAATDLCRELSRVVPRPRQAAAGSGAAAGDDLVAVLDHGTDTVLRALVTGPPDHEAAPAHTRIGQVVWLARDGGWVGVRAEPDQNGRRLVQLVPVTAADLGTWVAPYVAQVLA